MKKDIAMAPLDEFISDLDIAADTAENLDMRQQNGDFHGLLIPANTETLFPPFPGGAERGDYSNVF
jgi:hypothetical protein